MAVWLHLCRCGQLHALYSFSVQGMRLARRWRRCELTAAALTNGWKSVELSSYTLRHRRYRARHRTFQDGRDCAANQRRNERKPAE